MMSSSFKIMLLWYLIIVGVTIVYKRDVSRLCLEINVFNVQKTKSLENIDN